MTRLRVISLGGKPDAEFFKPARALETLGSSPAIMLGTIGRRC